MLFLRGSIITLADVEYIVGSSISTTSVTATTASATLRISARRSRATRARSPSWKLASAGMVEDADDMEAGTSSASNRRFRALLARLWADYWRDPLTNR